MRAAREPHHEVIILRACSTHWFERVLEATRHAVPPRTGGLAACPKTRLECVECVRARTCDMVSHGVCGLIHAPRTSARRAARRAGRRWGPRPRGRRCASSHTVRVGASRKRDRRMRRATKMYTLLSATRDVYQTWRHVDITWSRALRSSPEMEPLRGGGLSRPTTLPDYSSARPALYSTMNTKRSAMASSSSSFSMAPGLSPFASECRETPPVQSAPVL